MPYIKPELRPVFDSAVVMAEMGNFADAHVRIMFAIKSLGDSGDCRVDGCLNYTFTQLLRKVENLNDAEQIIQLVIFNTFLTNPRYIKLERAIGLLLAMTKEFKRRGWRKEALRHIERLLNYVVEGHYVRYEEDKIRDNGDLK